MRSGKMNLSSSELFIGRLYAVEQAVVLEEMASGVAHELNQSLAAMATFSHAGGRMVGQTVPLIARAAEVFHDIGVVALGAGERLQSIRRMLTPELRSHTRCQMADLVVEMRPILNECAFQVGFSLTVDDDISVPDVAVDRLRIQHIVLAIVKNAAEANADHTDEPASRAISIVIAGHRHTVETSITNPGPHVSAETSARVFQPFYTTKPQHAGLGMASARAIVELHEGTIGFENLDLGGVRFWFRLPAAEPEDQ